MRKIILIGILLMFILSGCGKVEEPAEVMEVGFCGDDDCGEGENKCSCAEDCGKCEGDVEGKVCRVFECVDNSCEDVIKENCCGNGVCEKDEKDCIDCPACNDYDVCTEDWFDPEALECVNEEIEPCCGNNDCESGESCANCLVDCDCGVGLEDYPDIFKGETVTIIVGAKATASDVTAGTDISGSLSSVATIGPTKLDNEINSIEDRNAIVIGTPCDNKFSAELLPYKRDCLEYIEEGTAVIRLFKTGSSSYAVLIAGNPISKTREAAGWLRDYSSYDLEGGEVIVS